jgi:hypothetical protein
MAILRPFWPLPELYPALIEPARTAFEDAREDPAADRRNRPLAARFAVFLARWPVDHNLVDQAEGLCLFR